MSQSKKKHNLKDPKDPRNRIKISKDFKTHSKDRFERDKAKLQWSSREEHKGNALAPGADEGRDKLRKASGRRK